MAYALREAPAETELTSPRELVQEIDRAGLERAAESGARISAVREFAQEHLQELVATGQIDPEAVSDIQEGLRTAQSQRMAEVRGDTSVRIERMGGGVAGYYDGSDIVLHIDHIDQGVYDHEAQHRKDGLPADLDADLAPETGISAIDERLEGVGTKRDLLEERAMDAAGEIPAAYRETHWATVKEIEQRGDDVGVDMEHADSRLVTTDGDDAYSAALVELSVREIAEEDPEALAALQEEAERTGADPDVLRVIAQTRSEYQNGRRDAPKAVPTAAV